MCQQHKRHQYATHNEQVNSLETGTITTFSNRNSKVNATKIQTNYNAES